jgi:hypothetical protein
MKKLSWLTTLFGSLAGIAELVSASSPDPKTQYVARIVSGIALVLLGGSARDNKVTSEQAGAVPTPPAK